VSRNFFGIEKGLDIYQQDGGLLVRILSGFAQPDGVSGDQDSAPIGSLYVRSGTGELYQKIANDGLPSDFDRFDNPQMSVGSWRSEKLLLVTNEVQGAGVRDVVATPFLDDDGAAIPISEYSVGKWVITDADGSPVLMKITDVTGDNVTFTVMPIPPADGSTPPLSSGDTFVCEYYLPDSPDGQEGLAIVVFNGSVIIKIADLNWNFADGINLAASYSAVNGSITSADTVNSAIEKLDGNQQDLTSALGVSQGDVDFGSFDGVSLDNDQNAKQLFQRIEVLLEQLRGVQVAGITAEQTVDSVPHASVKTCKWLVEAFEEASPANRKALEVYALNDGAVSDHTVYARLAIGSDFNLSISVDVSGADMRLRAASTSAGVTVTARRIEVVKSTL
jgi:hypothetical protein